MDKLFLLKLTLAPALVAAATLISRRYGQKVGGWVAGFPIVAGPALFVYALEQGTLFAARAATATLEGLLSLCAFCLAYAWRGKMPVREGGRPPSALSCLLAGYAAFAAFTLLLGHVNGGLLRSTLWALAALFLTLRSLPHFEHEDQPALRAAWDLPARMAAAAAMVFGLSTLASHAGPHLSGLLTPFPVASTVLVLFAHFEGGIGPATAVLKGLVAGLNSFAVFLALLALTLPIWGIAAAFAAALAAAGLSQAAVLWWMQRQKSVA